MVLLALDLDAKCPFALHPRDYADGLLFKLENRTLLDMRFEKGCRSATRTDAADNRGCADRTLRSSDSTVIPALSRILRMSSSLPRPAENGRSHHAGHEARSFLIHPGDDLNRSARTHAARHDRLDASSAARTPRAPSNLPPVGCVSICEPTSTGGKSGSAPG